MITNKNINYRKTYQWWRNLFGSQHKNKNMQMRDTRRDEIINLIAGKKFPSKGLQSKCQSNQLFMIETTGIWISPWTEWTQSQTLIKHRFYHLSVFHYRKTSFVKDKSLCCKILDSVRLIFSKNAFLAQC